MIAEPIVSPKQWTYAEVAQFEDDARFEIHDGALFERPSPTWNHQHIIGFLYRLLMAWADQNGGVAFVSPIDLYVSERKYFIPDLLFYSAASLQNPQVLTDTKRFRVAPDLIVDVASPSTESNDRTVKVRAYAEFGVANYWIVDAETQIIEALECTRAATSSPPRAKRAKLSRPPIFPAFRSKLRLFSHFPAPRRALLMLRE